MIKIAKYMWKEYKAGVITFFIIIAGSGVYEFIKGDFKIWLWATAMTAILFIGLVDLVYLIVKFCIKDKDKNDDNES